MNPNPHQLAESLYEMSVNYSRNSEEIANLLERRPETWNKIREGVKSDKAADREYEATPDGIKEMKLRLALKSLEKKMSAVKTFIHILEGEARNQF